MKSLFITCVFYVLAQPFFSLSGIFNAENDRSGLLTYSTNNDLYIERISNSVGRETSSLCPTTDSPYQEICEATEGDFPKIKHLDANDNGDGVAWYPDNVSTEALDEETYLEDEKIYYLGAESGGCVGSRIEVTVSLALAPNAGRTTSINIASDSEPVDLRDLINTTYLRPEPDDGGFMVPALNSGSTIFDPSIDANFTGGKQFRHWVYSTNNICDDDSTIVYITIDPAPNTSHLLYYLGTDEEESKNFLEQSPPSTSEEGIRTNIWIDQPLVKNSIYKIIVNDQAKYYYVNNLYAEPDTAPAMTLTQANEITLIESSEGSNCTELITNNEENIGIGGLPNQNYGLTVEGGIYTDQVKVMDVDTWPDYVFSEGYGLLELDEVASYIKEEGHLPGLPSAEEVLSDGISLTQMDKANLKKLEELSLYLLDQHDRMERLRAPKTQKAPVLAYRTDKERPYNFVLDQSGIEEGQGQLKRMSTDSLSTGTMYCDGDNVGIGIGQTSGYRLAVAGGILSEGVKVSDVSNWPDYVFSDAYALLSLEDLRAYIETNSHLPGIPDATTIAREGYSLSKMDKLFMEKVEELTLYVIHQEAELQSLSGELGIVLPVREEEFVSDKTVYQSPEEEIETHLNTPTQKEGGTFPDMASPRSLEASPAALCDVISCDGEGVGIGTEPVAGYRLAVSGGILTEDIQVASVANWPDYVFEADYKLRDLLSLSAYIEREGHLPGVPKAEILGQEGYRLEVMDGLLLEKIEELTLYLIQQERQLTFLESRKQ